MLPAVGPTWIPISGSPAPAGSLWHRRDPDSCGGPPPGPLTHFWLCTHLNYAQSIVHTQAEIDTGGQKGYLQRGLVPDLLMHRGKPFLIHGLELTGPSVA